VIGRVVKGGVEAVMFNYYRAIDREMVQFDFIVDEDSPYEIPEDIQALGCKVFKIPPYKRLPTYIRALEKVFKENRYEVVHSHMNTLSVFTLYAAKRAGVPVRIAHSHSTAGRGETARNIMKYTLRPFSRVFPTHLFACSEYAGRWLFGNKVFDSGRVTVIRNAIDTSKFRFNPVTRERVRRELGIEDKFVVGHVGRFMPQKNHTFLLDIFAEVHRRDPDSVLLLIGDGELKHSMEEKTKRLGLASSVIFLGARDDVHELYQAMDVFVLPSLYEGLGMVAVEAQTSGLPCALSNRVPEEAKVIDDVEFLPIDNISMWADAILGCCGMMRKDGASRLQSQGWYIENVARELVEWYVEICK
jgi:glycosyltransferase EpsF